MPLVSYLVFFFFPPTTCPLSSLSEPSPLSLPLHTAGLSILGFFLTVKVGGSVEVRSSGSYSTVIASDGKVVQLTVMFEFASITSDNNSNMHCLFYRDFFEKYQRVILHFSSGIFYLIN